MISLTPARVRALSVPVGVCAGLLGAYALGLLGGAEAAPRSEVLAPADGLGEQAAPASGRRLASYEGRARVTPPPWATIPIDSEEAAESVPGPVFSADRMYAPPVPERQPALEAPRFLPRTEWVYDILRAGRLPGNYERWNPLGEPGGAERQVVPSLLPERTPQATMVEPETGTAPGPLPPREVPEAESATPVPGPKAAAIREPEPGAGILSALRAWIPPFSPGVSPYPREDEPTSLLPTEYEPDHRSARVMTPSGTSPVPIAGY